MDALIAYDINVQRHDELKGKLLEKGFYDRWRDPAQNKTHELPDTTLWINNVLDSNHARTLFYSAVDELNEGKNLDEQIKTTKFVAVHASVFLGIPNNRNS